MKISGFTIVRNASVLNYPFRESVLSLLPFCDELIINCGDSEDDTLSICREFCAHHPKKIRLIQEKWETHHQRGGWQLKAQTDRALSECQHGWCFYLQADEVIHGSDRMRIVHAIEIADCSPKVDGIVFDYFHFYGNFSYTIEGRNWYRREVRLFKNHRSIKAFRDAQGFRKAGKRLIAHPAHCPIYHYGYVRSIESMKQKSREMSRWWGKSPSQNDLDFSPVKHVGLKQFDGTHPDVMKNYIQKNHSSFDPEKCRRKWDKNEIKNALSLAFEKIFRFRIGEFRNYKVPGTFW